LITITPASISDGVRELQERTLRYHEIAATTHEMLRDWGVYVRMTVTRGHCSSIEYRYRPERVTDGEEEERRTPQRSIDQVAARLVESVVCAPTFPRDDHWLLREHYVNRARSESICRVMGILFRDYDDRLASAVLIVGGRIELLRRRGNCAK
jgi:hypothetical protein